MNFVERKVSVKRTISILSKNGIEVDEQEAGVILDFLYLIAKNYGKREAVQETYIPKEMSNSLKTSSGH